jgi:DNA replication licensing factor MCM3
MHRYIAPGIEEGTPVPDTLSQPLSVDSPSASLTFQETNPFEKYDPLLHAGVADGAPGTRTRSKSGGQPKPEVLSIAFVKKYIQYAKARAPPVLTKGAAELITEVYSRFRNDETEGNKKKVCVLLEDRTVGHFISLTDISVDCSVARDLDSPVDGTR